MTELSSPGDRTPCTSKLKKCLEFASTLFVPLLLGIFAAVITFHQQNAADRQRLEDRQLAREQREQDLNLRRCQREQDLNLTHYQREQDQELARSLREQDLISSRQQLEFQRGLADEQLRLDLNISQQQEALDLIIAEKQRNMFEKQRLHELDIEITRHREDLFTAYINEMSMLLDNFKGTPTEDPLTAILMRVNTLTVIRQLDPVRKSHLVHFLYTAGQLTDGQHPPPIDLSGAELDNIDLSRGANEKPPMHGLSLAGAYLRNASFAKRDLSGANFRGAILIGAQFNNTILTGANLGGANLFKTMFYLATLIRTNFAGANLTKAYLKDSKLHGVQFTSETILDHADLSFAVAQNVSFSNMTSLSFTSFISCGCAGAHFDNAILTGSDFSRAMLNRATFRRAILDRVRLFAANTENADFTQASMFMTNCAEMKSARATFYLVEGLNTVFRKADLSSVNFTSAIFDNADFSEAIMSYSTLTHCRLIRTNWSKSNLYAANLSLSDLTEGCDLTEEQLFSAASIRSTLLPNGTLGRDDASLITNGSAVCNTTMVNALNPLDPLNASNLFYPLKVVFGWTYPASDHIITRPFANNSDDCVFAPAPKSTRPILVKQSLNLFKYRPHIAAERLVLFLSARFGNATVISLEWEGLHSTDKHRSILRTSGTILSARLTGDIVNYVSTMDVGIPFGHGSGMEKVVVVIQVQQDTNDENWFDDIVVKAGVV